jgi:hypothetical protein
MEGQFSVYKGLQKPLVFKMFRGRFIYWGLGSIVLGLLLCMALSSLINLFAGIVALAIITGGGLALTATKQRKGLHAKNRHPGIHIHPSKYTRHDQNQNL